MSWTPDATSSTASSSSGRLAMPWPSSRCTSRYEADHGARAKEHRAHQSEEAQRLLGELGQEEERRDVQQTSRVHARAVDPRPGVLWVLGTAHLVHQVPLAQRQRRYEPVQVSVERQRLGHRPAHEPHPAGDVVERAGRSRRRTSGGRRATAAD